MILGMQGALEMKAENLEIRGDNKTVIRQMKVML